MQTQNEYHGYFLTECIKQHQYGKVYLGQASEEAEPEFVIKIFNTQLISLRERQRFLQEANVLTSLRHPALLPLLDVGIDKGNPYLIRRYAPEGSLITQLSLLNGEAFSLPTVMAILTRIGAAVTYLHEEQVCHGGIKPENILFDINKQALLADVHIASIYPDVYKPTITGRELVQWGQPTTAPDDRKSGMQDDIYALSSIAYELLTGYQPFTSANEQDAAPVPPSHWVSSLSKDVDQVFLQALSPHLEERFSQAIFFVEALQRALDTSMKEKVAPSTEKQPTPLLPPPVEQRQLVPFQPKSVFQQSVPARLATQQRPLRHLLLAERKAGVLSTRLSLIVLIALLVLASILVPALLFHPQSSPAPTHKTRSQALTGHTASVATSQSGPTATPIQNQKPTPIPTSIPTPTPTPKPTPTPMPVVVNAGFEAPALSGDYQYAPNNPGWTFSNDSGIASNGSALTQGTSNAPGGVQVAFIQAYGTISQNVSFAQGTYKISFLAAQRIDSSSAQSLYVMIDNTVVGSFTPVGGNYLYYTTPSFTVSPGIHTLQFRGLKGGAHNTVFIDSVTIIN